LIRQQETAHENSDLLHRNPHSQSGGDNNRFQHEKEQNRQDEPNDKGVESSSNSHHITPSAHLPPPGEPSPSYITDSAEIPSADVKWEKLLQLSNCMMGAKGGKAADSPNNYSENNYI
jgi:hypothetical protein